MDPNSRGIYTNYSSFSGYDHDFRFGGSSSGGAGGCGGGFGAIDEDGND